MIPVRLPADFASTTMGRLLTLTADHPLIGERCLVCDEPFDAVRPLVLVPVGIAPELRNQGGYATGRAVAVHADCATPIPST